MTVRFPWLVTFRRVQHRLPVMVLLGVTLLAPGAGLIFHQTSRALRDADARLSTEASIPVRITRVDRSAPERLEPVASAPTFVDVAVFDDHLYLSGSGGLTQYDLHGTFRKQFRPGSELPSAPLGALVNAVLSDAGGPELLVATRGEGLLAFDGQSFRHIRPDEESYRQLTALLPLNSGGVLVGTEKRGVLVFDGRTLRSFHPSLTTVHVTALAGDESSLWVGTLDRGVVHIRGGRTEYHSESGGLPDVRVLSIAVEGDRTYIGTPLGVAEFRDGRFARVLGSGFFARAVLIRGETLVVGTLDEGVVEIPLNTGPSRQPRPSAQATIARVERLLAIDEATLALSEGRVYRRESGAAGWKPIMTPTEALLTHHNVSALAVDGSDRLWVGYFDRGLDIVEPGLTRVRHLESEHIFCINRIVHDRDGAMSAVATANGLVLFDPAGRERQVLDRSDGLIANHVTDVVLDRGRLIVATPAGVTFIDGSGTRSLYAFHGLVNNHAYSLGSTGERLLVGTLGGLSILDGAIVRASFTTTNSALRHNWITAITPVGSEWFVGTYGAGLQRLDASGRWLPFLEATGKFEVNPNALVATDTHVYAGTLGKGLFIYDRATGRWSSMTDGLPSRNVTALAVGRGYVYIGTDNGVVRAVERSLSPS